MASVVRVIPLDIYERLVASGSLEPELRRAKSENNTEIKEKTQIVQSGGGVVVKEKCKNLIHFEERFILK